MALPKTKVRELLRTLYPGVNLSNKRITAIAEKTKLPDDADDDAITEMLEDMNDMFPFAEMAKNDDRLRNIENKPKDEKKPTDSDEDKPKDEKEPADKPDDKTGDGKLTADAIAKIVQAAVAPLTAEIATLKAGKTADTRLEQLKGVLKGSDEKYSKRMLRDFARMKFEKDEDFEEYLEELTEEAKDFAKTDGNESKPDTSGGSFAPGLGTPGKTGVTAGTAAYIKSKQDAKKAEGALAGKQFTD